MPVVYISGPYSSDSESVINENIRHATIAAAEAWRNGLAAICPHKNTERFEKIVPEVTYQTYIDGDVEMVKRCDAIVMLPPWEKSKGSVIERKAAQDSAKLIFYYPYICETKSEIDEFWLGVKADILEYKEAIRRLSSENNIFPIVPGKLEVALSSENESEQVPREGQVPEENILQEAQRIVHGARGAHYGTPLANHQRTADLWAVLFNTTITAEQVCDANILQKVARSMEVDKRDNAVDICGYAHNKELIKKERNEKW